MARDAKAAIASHELVCAQRWASTMATMNDIKRVLSWGNAALITTLLAAISWLATRAF